MVKISELRVGDGKIVVEGNIKSVSDVRAFNKFGKDLRVANAILEDESGAVKLTLWNDEIDRVKNGDKIRIVNGFVNEYNGEKQLTAGKFGKIEMV